jgi:hypothetical protein
MKLRIESDGTLRGTRLVDAATGEEIEGVREVTWEWERGYPANVRVVLQEVETDLAVTLDGRVAGLR